MVITARRRLSRYFTAAPLRNASGAQLGHVFRYEGQPSWLFASSPRPRTLAPAPSTATLSGSGGPDSGDSRP